MRLTWFSLTVLLAVVLAAATADMTKGPDPASARGLMMASSSIQAGALALMAPLHGLWLACGILAGLVLRDRVPLKGSHSSPTAAWLAKRVMAVSAVVIAAFGLGAMRVDPAWMHGAAACHAGGWLVYLRNLPTRL